MRWWLGPGQTWRLLTAGWTIRVYLPIAAGLMLTAIVMAAARVTSEHAWLVVTRRQRTGR
uniref:hypothetical protein n=1 Tax=Herbidospora sakaeratensis TaxID=564415 RepID=UPI0007835CDC|nr:hypothetical protein [Herbidospora sakaeratensis]